MRSCVRPYREEGDKDSLTRCCGTSARRQWGVAGQTVVRRGTCARRSAASAYQSLASQTLCGASLACETSCIIRLCVLFVPGCWQLQQVWHQLRSLLLLRVPSLCRPGQTAVPLRQVQPLQVRNHQEQTWKNTTLVHGKTYNSEGT